MQQKQTGRKAIEDMSLDELDEFEDDEDEAALEMYRYARDSFCLKRGRICWTWRAFPFFHICSHDHCWCVRRQRIAEMKASAARKRFGEMINITGVCVCV